MKHANLSQFLLCSAQETITNISLPVMPSPVARTSRAWRASCCCTAQLTRFTQWAVHQHRQRLGT